MSDKQKRGIFYDAAQTVEDMRKLISWFRIEDCRTDMVRFGNEFAHPLGADALSMDTSAGIAARTNITAPETFPQLREEVQNGSKRAFDQAIPSGKSSAGGRSMTIFPAARKNPMHPSFMRWYAD